MAHPIYEHVSTLTKMIDNIIDRAGENKRTDHKREHEPLNQAIDRMQNVFIETQVEYERNCNAENHYTHRKREPTQTLMQVPMNEMYLNTIGDSNFSLPVMPRNHSSRQEGNILHQKSLRQKSSRVAGPTNAETN